jgi:hypothetical protein
MKFIPREYQKAGIRFLVSRREAALLLKPGRGKTAATLAAFQLLARTSKMRALVLAPLRVCYDVWSASGEIGRWDQFKGLRVALLHGPKKEEEFRKKADIYVINYEGLDWLCAPRDALKAYGLRNVSRLDELLGLSSGGLVLVCDELSKFKHTKTKRFKALRPYLPRFAFRWGLTGSPAANSLENLFGECYVLDLGKRLGRYITHFRQNYFIPCGFQGKEWRPAPGAEERIYAAIKDLALVIDTPDSGEPELVTNNVWVDLPPKARKFYDVLEEEMIAEIDGNVVVAGSAGVVSGKCRQIASGGIYTHGLTQLPKGRGIQGVPEVQPVHDAKTEALVDLVDELQGQPLMVGFEFKHDRARIRKALGNVPSIDGDCNPAQASAIIADWNASKTPVLLIHPQAGGHGLNLQGCSCANFCFYTCPWDRELYDQVIARVCRQGSKAEVVVVHRLLARDTVDEAVVRALGAKGKTEAALFAALKEYSQERKAKKCAR